MQGLCLTRVNLEVSILLSGIDEQEQLSASNIARLADCLLSQGVTVRLNIQAMPEQRLLPATLQILTPLLRHVVLYEIKDPFVEYTHEITEPYRITAIQQAVLSSAAQLETLCVQTCRSEFFANLFIRNIGILRSLTKLHLTLPPCNFDLRPLALLNSLEDCALQCNSCMQSCAEVLTSNRHSLQRVTLTSKTWSLETYSALHGVFSLKRLVLKVTSLTTYAAASLGRLLGPEIRILLENCSVMKSGAFKALSSGMAKIKQLVLFQLDDTGLAQLNPLPSLRQLTLVYSSTTGQRFKRQAKLTDLKLIACPAISDKGIDVMIRAFPALQHIAFLAIHSTRLCRAHRLTLSRESLSALSHLKCLNTINMSGLSRVTASDMHCMQASFGAQQAVGKAQPRLAVLRPSQLSLHSNCADWTVLIAQDPCRPQISIGSRGHGHADSEVWTVQSRITHFLRQLLMTHKATIAWAAHLAVLFM